MLTAINLSALALIGARFMEFLAMPSIDAVKAMSDEVREAWQAIEGRIAEARALNAAAVLLAEHIDDRKP